MLPRSLDDSEGEERGVCTCRLGGHEGLRHIPFTSNVADCSRNRHHDRLASKHNTNTTQPAAETITLNGTGKRLAAGSLVRGRGWRVLVG
jgi:hypothetical protein